MSKLPNGFKTRESYNAYMRSYKAKRRREKREQRLMLYWRPMECGWFIPRYAVEEGIVEIHVQTR